MYIAWVTYILPQDMAFRSQMVPYPLFIIKFNGDRCSFSFQLQTLPPLLHHSLSLLYLPAATAVDFILSLGLLYMNRLIATHTCIFSSYVGTQPPPPRYQLGVECLFPSLAEVLW